ncbi:MAG: hypothetical protein A2847_01745 [Candidatus Sungbacteria bacterium RIFCSPHIGHO2_01_FULL_50_25]|uniref:Uncharacterized protein n=1 Tax=Candidatus Sungbacteria bacterium RIFCSPHIGHO2_01_FULL_50_25 TaxID=1802265 RepID=A0A1G2KBY6_9BACT|nr:MAG: hypothetical protein A2847_01745 [Candidatus Sungbacteria bacterium RIFCSPHIGHO2_01_FULL_50_25]
MDLTKILFQGKCGGTVIRISATAPRGTAADTAPTISGGSDKQRRIVAVQVGPDGIEWCHFEPISS